MRIAIVAFAAGVWTLQQQATLPEWGLVATLGGTFVAGLAAAHTVAARSARGAQAIAALASLALGFSFAAGVAKVRLADRLDAVVEGRDVTLAGVVASLPQPFERGVRFELDVERVVPTTEPYRAPSRILVSWYNGLTPEEFQEVLPIRAGERWRFTVRLRRPHGNSNPHGFDYEGWLLERGIGATGYVRPRGERTKLADMVWTPSYAIERAREQIRTKLWDALPEHRYAGVLIALAIGDQRAIESVDWETFTRTGVGHLMSISGLHVTMVSGLFAALAAALWRRSPRLVLRLPARKAAAVAAVAAATIYTLLAGFAVPAQRTLYMVTVVAVALWLDRMQSSSRVLAAALAVVLLLDPWAVMSPGFWLSFGAVALMLYVGAADAGRVHWLARWGRVQWAITVGLAPFVLLLFQQVSLIAPVANAVAIPVVSLLVTPLALAAAVTPGPWVAEIAHAALAALMQALDWLAQLPGAAWRQHAPAPWAAVLALVGAAWLLAPRGVPARYAAAALFVPLFAVRPAAPADGELRVTFLDVGQGLAALVRTREHSLLYDAGPAYSLDADAGDRVVVPFLRGEGLDRLDAVVVTHNDADHSGGARSVMRTLPVGALWSSLERDHPAQSDAPYRLPCRGGVRWSWDGFAFELLHPPASSYGDPFIRANSRSCVLRVSGPAGAVLLTGDIEERDERSLLAAGAPLRADVLLVPHHGSGTSSTSAFIAAVQPAHAVFTTGYRNRFGHPKPDVLTRYLATGAAAWRTDRDGAVTLTIAKDGVRLARRRDEAPRYWR
ncbi:MAG TPA: DNA internalization-related competence protein ComEC/Rec2 [Burkholderiales bacterium]|nr:DNA internalization-related competence protein ComEC/Rec2 [Burkholderiales bacterium]